MCALAKIQISDKALESNRILKRLHKELRTFYGVKDNLKALAMRDPNIALMKLRSMTLETQG